MFFDVSMLGLDIKVNVDFYPNGSTYVSAVLDGEEYELSIKSDVYANYDFTTFVTNRDLQKELKLEQEVFIELNKGSSLLGENSYRVYKIDLNKVKAEIPGVFIDSLIRTHDVKRSALHETLNLSHMTVFRVINQGEKITVPLALKLGKLFKVDPEILIKFQTNYDLIQSLRDPELMQQLSNIKKADELEKVVI